MALLSTFFSFLLLIILTIILIRRSHNKAQPAPGLRRLPGPKGMLMSLVVATRNGSDVSTGLPWLGPAYKVQAHNPWLSFWRWARHYGPIYEVTLGGRQHIWISDEKIAHDLFSKRGGIYSDRVRLPTLITDNRSDAR